jgi:polar amino acid transport system substrate-binding protein
MRNIVKLLLLASCVLLSSQTFAKEALRIGVSPNYPPLVYKKDGQLTGIDVAAGEAIAQQLDRKPEFVEMPFNQLIPALQAGKIDIIMSGMSITPERSKLVSFSNSYLSAGQMAIIRYADAGRFGFKGVMFRPDSRIAVVKNTTGEEFANKNLTHAAITRCDSIEEALSKLRANSVDFVIHDAATSWSLATDESRQDLMSLNNELTDEHLGWAVSKENTALLQAVNQQLANMQKTGMLRAIINKWVPVTVEVEAASTPSLPANTHTSTSSSQTIRK